MSFQWSLSWPTPLVTFTSFSVFAASVVVVFPSVMFSVIFSCTSPLVIPIFAPTSGSPPFVISTPRSSPFVTSAVGSSTPVAFLNTPTTRS